MARPLTSPDHLFDRTWRPGHPFRPRLSRWRRLGMALLLAVLCFVIGAYWYFTDSERVRALAQDSLSQLVGARVRVRSATLSIFQGLRLNDVRVYLDSPSSGQKTAAGDDEDALLFRADALLVRADPSALFDGRLEPTQIVAIGPLVRLTEDLASGQWNHQRLRLRNERPGDPATRETENRPMQLPEVLLRNAVVDYSQIDSNGTRRVVGTMALEGQLGPGLEKDIYLFKLQSRGATQGLGPSIEGRLDTAGGRITASLSNFRYGADLEAMLPEQVRRWCQEHGLAGRVDVPELTYQRGGASSPGSRAPADEFHAEIDVQRVDLSFTPDELLSADELLHERWNSEALEAMRAAGLDEVSGGFVSQMQQAVQPTAIALHQVTGKFVFTNDSIDIQNVSGFVESNGIRINGRIGNYSNPGNATASIRVASSETQDIVIPASPRYINSMPQPVREIYDHLRPQGRCRFWFTLDRATPGSRPTIGGEVEILDGMFIFDKFPYPIHGATGKLVFGHHPTTGEEQLEIRDIRGHGPPGGPNADARVKIVGLVSPFGAETGVRVTVTGDDVVSEPLLFSSFPRETQTALKLFDAPGKGEFPVFRGGFRCEVERPRGLEVEWNVVTDIRLDEASGVLVAFPYPMSGVSGELTVTEDHVTISHATMKRDGATLSIDGKVSWGDDEATGTGSLSTRATRDRRARGPAAPRAHSTTVPADRLARDDKPGSLRPELKVVARNVPVDENLLSALPEDQRVWLRKLGVEGRFDLDGEVVSAAAGGSKDSAIGFDFLVTLRDAALRLSGGAGTQPDGRGAPAVTAVNGRLRLTPQRVAIDDLVGKRGDADLTARGNIAWGDGGTHVALVADAKSLLLNESLRALLPSGAQLVWDQVRPEGTLDAALTYSGDVGATSPAAGAGSSGSAVAGAPNAADREPAGARAQQPRNSAIDGPGGFKLVLQPRTLSATPKAAPYRLDQLTGEVLIGRDSVELRDLTARHGEAKIRLSGTGSFGTIAGGSTWDFRLSGDGVPVDADLVAALPTGLADMVKSLKTRGTIGFEFDKLRVGGVSHAAGDTAAPVSTTLASAKAADGPESRATTRPALIDPQATVSIIDGFVIIDPSMILSETTTVPDTVPAPAAASSAAHPTTAAADAPADVDFAVTLRADPLSLDLGVPLDQAVGTLRFTGASRGGKLAQLDGTIDMGTASLAGRPASDLRATFVKPPDAEVLSSNNIEMRIAGGTLAGKFYAGLSDTAPTRYAVELFLRDADVTRLTGDAGPDLRGQLSANLSLAGVFGDPSSRKGRGDVSVSGQSMYKIPLMLGLLQITNLSLPITSPFSQAAVSYGVDGQRVTFESIEMRAPNMTMSGSGHLDFASKQVRLTFTTDNTTWPKLPIIGEFIQGARNELLTIHVKGTLEEPKVSAGALNTLTTTVDEVFRGNETPK